MSKEQTDLLACPFCGSAPQWEENDAVDARSWGPEYRIACRNAACFGPVTSNYGNRPDAIAAWNRRASPSPAGGVQGVTDALDRARKTLDQAKATGENPTSQRALEYRLGELIDLVAALSSQAQTTGGVE